MKRFMLATSLLASFLAFPSRAQDTPAAVAQKQEAEERYKTMNARMENLEEAIASYQKRLTVMAEEVKSLREEIARLGNNNSVNAATQKSLESLAEAIKEVDRKRMADNEKVIAELERFRKGLIEKPSVLSPRTNTVSPGFSKNPSEKGYEYTIRANDNPYVIAPALTKQGHKVTAQQIIDANPGVNWNRLRIGQKIFIPAPAQP